MKLIIRESQYGKVLSAVQNITIAPIKGSTVTTNDGIYEIDEIGFDYVKNHVNVYSTEYNHDPVELYNDFGNIIPS